MFQGPSSPFTGLPSRNIPTTARPSIFMEGVTDKALSVLLWMTAETIVESPTTKNLGASRRTSNGSLVRTVALAIPNWFPWL